MNSHYIHTVHSVTTARQVLLRTAVIAAALVLSDGAWAMVKCVDGGGKVTFQDVMCDNQSSSVAVLQRFGQATTEAPPARGKTQQAEAPQQPERQASSKTR